MIYIMKDLGYFLSKKIFISAAPFWNYSSGKHNIGQLVRISHRMRNSILNPLKEMINEIISPNIHYFLFVIFQNKYYYDKREFALKQVFKLKFQCFLLFYIIPNLELNPPCNRYLKSERKCLDLGKQIEFY